MWTQISSFWCGSTRNTRITRELEHIDNNLSHFYRRHIAAQETSSVFYVRVLACLLKWRSIQPDNPGSNHEIVQRIFITCSDHFRASEGTLNCWYRELNSPKICLDTKALLYFLFPPFFNSTSILSLLSMLLTHSLTIPPFMSSNIFYWSGRRLKE